MRFFPGIFMLSDAEDEEAHRLLLEIYLNTAKGIDMQVTDGYLDCKCFDSLEGLCTVENGIHLHRCLQHVRGNVQKEAKAKNKDGFTRLRRPGHLKAFDRCITSSAWFPDDIEFHTFWTSFLARCNGKTKKTD